MGNELAGFVLLNQIGFDADAAWNMGEFFILAKFQGKGIGRFAASQIWKTHAGLWEVSVIPENKRGLNFWRKAISNFTSENYKEEMKIIDDNAHPSKRVILRFD